MPERGERAMTNHDSRRVRRRQTANGRYRRLYCYVVGMKTPMNLDDALVHEAMAIHRGKTKTAVVELGLQELINADRRRRLGEGFGSQPDLREVARRRSAPDPR